MDGIDTLLDVERHSLSKCDSIGSEDGRMIGVIVVVRSKGFEMTFMSWLRHEGRKKRGVFILFQSYLFVNNHIFVFGIACLTMMCFCRISDNLR